MTLHRRRRPHSPAPQDRLRALGLADSPAARRLHARIPRPVEADSPAPPIPRAPYALDTVDAPYGPPVDTAEEAALDTTVQRTRLAPPTDPDPDTVPTERLGPARDHHGGHRSRVAPPHPEVTPARIWRGHGPGSHLIGRAATPGHDRAREVPGSRPRSGTGDRHEAGARQEGLPHGGPGTRDGGSAHGRGDRAAPAFSRRGNGDGIRPGTGGRPGARHEVGPPEKAHAGQEGLPHGGPGARDGGSARGRGVEAGRDHGPGKPPSGYTEFDPAESLVERWTRRWAAHAALSRRAVLALTVLGLLAVGATLMALRDRPQTVEPGTAAQAATGPAPQVSAAPGGEVVVHVSGDVADPGLYTLNPGSRVSDALDAAGGPLPDAELDRLNLARPLTDGEQIVVGPPDPEDTAAGAADGRLVNVNQADAATLETLPGIGEVIAANIIAHREEHGPFVQVEDLIDVSKIGEAVLADITPLITVG